MRKKILIVGGVAGGASAAARLRRLDENAEIILLERGEHISFANCGLPYYLGGVIPARESLFVQTPQKMHNELAIDARTLSEVTAVDTANKTVTIASKNQGTYQESYDILILSPGAKPLKPAIPGIDHKRIFTLRNVADTDAINTAINTPGVNRAVVIGGGFIGVEMAENLRHKGLSVTLIEAARHVMAPFDSDMAALLERELEEQGVGLILGDGVKAFHQTSDTAVDIELVSGKKVAADVVIFSVGVTPDVAFLKESGLAFGPKGHILVNEHMQTSDPAVYAVGDAVETTDFISGQKMALALAGPANRQGRIAADNIAGLTSSYRGVVGSSVIKVFSMTAAATGYNERTLQRLGMSYKIAYAHPEAHASYYPGSTPISLKLLYDESGSILGAQGIGHENVDKSIDLIATLIKLKGTVRDLADLELCYAPPYSSAKAPVNLLAYVAENALNGLYSPITYEQYLALDKATITTLDVRSPMEFGLGHLEGAINIPLEEVRNRLHELDKEKPLVTYCKIGRRSYLAARILMQHGFTVKSISGGMTSIAGQSFTPGEPNPAVGTPITGDTSAAQTGVPEHNEHLDACGLSCPGPLMQLKARMDSLPPGHVLKITASDPGFFTDVAAWSAATGNELLYRDKGKIITAYIKKGSSSPSGIRNHDHAPASDHKTIIVFSNDMDKVLASLIIANGAQAMGKKVTLFFTFWGLSVLRKPMGPTPAKGWIEKAFDFILPRGASRLPLSKINMLGLGSGLMRFLMKKHNVSSPQELLSSLMAGGAEIVACQMSMDLMGFTHEELIEGVTLGGVGHYLGQADNASMNLFI